MYTAGFCKLFAKNYVYFCFSLNSINPFTIFLINTLAICFSSLFNISIISVISLLVALLVSIFGSSSLNKKSKLKLFKKHARGISVFTVYLIALILLVIIINFVLPAVYESISELVVNLPNYYNSAINFVNDLPEESFISREAIQNIISNLQKI